MKHSEADHTERLMPQLCKNGHKWYALVLFDKCGCFYKDDRDGICPKCHNPTFPILIVQV